MKWQFAPAIGKIPAARPPVPLETAVHAAKSAPDIEELRRLVQEDSQAVDRLIRARLYSEVALINQLSHYIIAGGGKRLRPLLALLSAKAAGYEGTRHIDVAVIIELVHTATLLHDDVVDVGAKGQATHLFAARIDVLFQAIADAADMANQQQAGAGTAAAPAAAGTFAPASLVWLAAVLLLLGTVGVLVTARIVLAVLLALGPVFIVLALLRGTRGLCAGWLRALVLVAITPLLAVLGGGLTIELAVPVVLQLAGPEGIEARPAFALFLVAAVHCALMALALRTAGTMVSGWQVFGLAGSHETSRERSESRTVLQTGTTPAVATAGAAAAGASRTRATFTPAPAIGGAASSETRRTVTTHMTGTHAPTSLPPLRAQGIGSRWRRPVSAEILR